MRVIEAHSTTANLGSSTMPQTPRTAWSPMSWSVVGIRHCSTCASLSFASISTPVAAISVLHPPSKSLEAWAADLEAVWHHPDTDVRLRKRIVRTLIHAVIVDVEAEAGEIVLIIHWKGGVHTERRLPRRRRGQSSRQTSKGIIDAVRVLGLVCSDDVIAGVLNRNGLRTGRGNRWTRERVTSLRSWNKSPCYSVQRCDSEGWMNLTEAAHLLGISARTLR
jgi:hypothetical protein